MSKGRFIFPPWGLMQILVLVRKTLGKSWAAESETVMPASGGWLTLLGRPGGVLLPPNPRGLAGRCARQVRPPVPGKSNTHGNRSQGPPRRPAGQLRAPDDRPKPGGGGGGVNASLRGKSAKFPLLRQSSSPTRVLSHPGCPRSPPPPSSRGAETQPARGARRPPRKPEPGSLSAYPDCHQDFPPPSGLGAPPRPHTNRFPESLAPLYLGRAAARSSLQQLRLPAWLTRGIAANHPISAPSPGQADQSAVSSGPEAGTESGSGKPDDRRKRLERPFAVCARAGLGGGVRSLVDLAFRLHFPAMGSAL